jgi:hypothetical protein
VDSGFSESQAKKILMLLTAEGLQIKTIFNTHAMSIIAAVMNIYRRSANAISSHHKWLQLLLRIPFWPRHAVHCLSAESFAQSSTYGAAQ